MVFLAPSLHDKIFSTYKAEHHVDLTDMELIDRFTNHSLWDQHTLYGIGALIHMIILATPVAFDSQAQVMNNLYRITLFNRREDEGLTLSVSTNCYHRVPLNILPNIQPHFGYRKGFTSYGSQEINSSQVTQGVCTWYHR